MEPNNFRYDINALRAISVVMVVLYHFKVPGFSSGFMGVDIFFAISGYLMTGIISRGISGDNLSVMGFYSRRFNRLYPALAFMIVTVMVFGYYTLTTVDYAILAKNSLSSAFFVSNVYYFFNSGYFDQSSLLNWLLHTWSLSVEWQFYLVYPLILLVCSKTFKSILPAIIIMMAVSVYFSATMTFDNKDAGYFLLHTRAWEMLAGGVAFFINGYTSHRFKYKNIASYFGWTIVLLSLVMIPESTMWPGYTAIIPVFGACVILSVNADHKFVYRNAFTKNIGLWSYSIYLWHWPIVVYIYSSGSLNSAAHVVAGLIASTAMGFISYTFIESTGRKKLIANLGIVSIPVMLASCIFIIQTEGLKYRVGDKLYDILSYKMDWSSHRNASCFLNPKQKPEEYKKCPDVINSSTLLFWGDSHSAHLISGFVKKNHGYKGIAERTGSMCPPLLGADIPERPYCKETNNYIIDEIRNDKPGSVILSAAWIGYSKVNPFERLKATIHALKDAGVKHVYVVGPIPMWMDTLPNLIEKNGLSAIPLLGRENVRKETFSVDEKMKEELKGVPATYISLIDSMCTKEACYTIPEGFGSAPMQFDIAHLTDPGSEYVEKIITRQMSN